MYIQINYSSKNDKQDKLKKILYKPNGLNKNDSIIVEKNLKNNLKTIGGTDKSLLKNLNGYFNKNDVKSHLNKDDIEKKPLPNQLNGTKQKPPQKLIGKLFR